MPKSKKQPMKLRSLEFSKIVENRREYSVETFTLGRYIVEEHTTKYEDGYTYKRYWVGNQNYEYLPVIEFEAGAFGNNRKEFKIQTVEYGLLSQEDIDQVIAGYKEAQEAVKVLTLYVGGASSI